MRKLVATMVATVVVANGVAVAGPVSFALAPKTPAQPASVSAAQATPASPRVAALPTLATQPSATAPARISPRVRFRDRWGSRKAAKPIASVRASQATSSPTSKAKTISVSPAAETPTNNTSTTTSPAAQLIELATATEASGDTQTAREQYRRAVGLAPSDAKTLRAAGHFEDRQGELAVAESLYRRAIASDPTSAAAVNDLAICLARQARLPESAAAFAQAIALNPTKKLYRNNIAKVLVELGDETAALNHLSAASGQAIAHYNLGYLLTTKGDTANATEHFQIALAADPTLDAARQALANLPAPQPVVVTESLPPVPKNVSTPGYYVATPSTVPASVPYAAPTYVPLTAPAVASPAFPRLLPNVQQR